MQRLNPHNDSYLSFLIASPFENHFNRLLIKSFLLHTEKRTCFNLFHSHHALCHHPDPSADFLVHVDCFKLISSRVGHRFWLRSGLLSTQEATMVTSW